MYSPSHANSKELVKFTPASALIEICTALVKTSLISH